MAQAPDEITPTMPAQHQSLWIQEAPGTPAPSLSENITVDTAVIGGGICGIVAASHLVEAGQTVALLEAARVLHGVTGHTTAKLTSQHGLIYDHILSTFGKKKAQQYADVNQQAIESVARRVEREGIECNFHRSPAFTYVSSEDQVDRIHDEVDAARELGLPASYMEELPLPFDVAAAVRFSDQAHFHPRRYLLALADTITAGGGAVYERTRITEVDGGAPCRVKTQDHVVRADDVIVATHFPVFDRAGYFARMRPKKSYVLAARLEGQQPEGMFYLDEEPIFSIRPAAGKDEDLVLFAGQNHRTGSGDETERYRQLERTVRERFDVASIEYSWSTQDFVSFDRVPFVGSLGPASDHLYTATGFGGWGMTNGIAAGRLLADAVLGQAPDELEVYDPKRIKGTSIKSFLGHNVRAAKGFVASRVRSVTKDSTVDLEPGEGKVLHGGGEAIAAYRDEDGVLHTMSAVCTHMGCEVEWNDADETWDCPCHGSRFEREGDVLDGPAVEGLEKKTTEPR